MTSSFTADAVAALAGPDWLRARRLAAFERFASGNLPSETEEVWRYSRISELDLEAYRPADTNAAAPGVPDAVDNALRPTGARAGLAVVVDGRIARSEMETDIAARGVTLGDLASLDDGDELLGAVEGPPVDAFCELNVALMTEGVALRVPTGVVVERPIVIMHWLSSDGLAVFPRTIVQVGQDAEVTVLEYFCSPDVNGLAVPVTELGVENAGRLRYVNVQTLGSRIWHVGYQASRAGRDATLHASAVALGGDYARLRTDSRLEGKGGSAELLAVYFGEGAQMHDFRTMQDHAAPHTTSELLFKGAVEDHARGVYSGLIRVRKEAQGTNAFQTNRNLVLSEGAHADSVPNLEIEANDVRCSHATAVGPVDADQLYYLESRGLPPDVAERLIVLGFIGEVLERLPIPELARFLRGMVGEKLTRRRA